MLLSVRVQGSDYLVDVGFGGVSLMAPLGMDVEGEQPTLFEPQRIVRNANHRSLQAKIATEWRDLYAFTGDPQFATDYDLANWFTSTHPASRFKQNLIVSKVHPEGRHVLFNRELSAYTASGIEKTTIDDPDALLAVLERSFDLSFPSGTRFGPPGSPWPS
jgi:N-hydroxyarylamine O-acetyltransferase